MPEPDLRARIPAGGEAVLSPEALRFVAKLHGEFDPRRRELLELRKKRQAEVDGGRLPDFLSETRKVREASWTVAPIPRDLERRTVEITGPVDRKMIINALNSGADVYMADFEDANAPTWENNVTGQMNLIDAARGKIDYISPEGKKYELNEKTAVLFARPRGWHLSERHVLIAGAPVSGSLFDFGLFFFHNARALIEKGTGPYFYLPKLQSHLEARLWNDVFNFAQAELGIPRGTIRATVLIETIWAGFEMDEILYELKDHSAGLNCGRWDYIFSFIKTFRNHRRFLLPDRSQVTMDKAFLKAYVDLLIQTCHRRGIHAMGGMAAQIPIRSDEKANRSALEKVREDKLREVKAGHDGTWVAHPGLIEVARMAFEEHMKGPNQIGIKRDGVRISQEDLLRVPQGTITDEGLRRNIRVAILYLESWLRGSGCVPLFHLMEDAATAEISRTQIWQWVRHGARTSEGTVVNAQTVEAWIREELKGFRKAVGESAYRGGKFEAAAGLIGRMSRAAECGEFLTLEAYPLID